jgi:serine/threonine-protein kinase
MLQRFYGEAEKMGMLRHPNIITVYDLGEHEGFPYIVMEFVEGDPLDRVIECGKAVSLFDKLRIIEQVCSALAYAHRSQVVHRDVKPANVIVRPDGIAKLLDFGIARQESNVADMGRTEPGGVIGTVPYMAPERLKGAIFDGRSDIFSAGVLLFQILAGRLPFTGRDYVLVNQLLNEKHPPLKDFVQDYPAAIDTILDHSLAKDPSDRYQTADEMAADLYPVIETLKEQTSLELIGEAQQLASTEDFIGAQNTLCRVLRIDPRNALARTMMKDLGLHISHKARTAQADQLQRDAETALRERNFDQAIQLLEEASRLVPDNSGIFAQLDAAKSKKQISEQILGYLQLAEQAKRLGDFTGAREIVDKAIQLDTSNSRLRAAYQSLVRQAESAAQQAKLNSTLESIRGSLANRDYQVALELCERAAQLHPDSVELEELSSVAKNGLLEQQRRTLVEGLEDRILHSDTQEDAEAVAQLVRNGLETFPTDATLLRLQAQIERTLDEHRTKSFVDMTIRQCVATMKTAPLEALKTVQLALLDAPGDSRLASLEERIRQHISRLTIEETRAAILQQANDALRQRNFAVAVSVLQQCVPPTLTPEISQLLEYARDQARQEERRQLIARSYAEAQSLLREEKYPECIALLGPVVDATKDTSLTALMAEGHLKLANRVEQEAAALASITPFVEAGCHEQVIAAIQAFPATMSTSPEIARLQTVSTLAWSQEIDRLEALGRAYAGLANEDSELMATNVEQLPGCGEIMGMREVFQERRAKAVDTFLTATLVHMSQAKEALLEPSASTRIAAGRPILPFASEAVREQWTHLEGEYRAANKMNGVLNRFRRKR